MDARYRILDGGFATEVIDKYDMEELNNDPLWNARLLDTNPDIFKSVHKSFLSSGADVIETGSYQATVQGFIDHLGVDQDKAIELIVTSGWLATNARDEFWQKYQHDHTDERLRPLVAGSIGPYGAYLHDGSEYTGNYVHKMSTQALKDWHRPQVAALVHSGVDLLAFDTIPVLKEAEAIAELLREFPSTTAWISFACKDGQHTVSGDVLGVAYTRLTQLNPHQIRGLGINCTSPDHVTSLLTTVPDSVRADTTLVVFPNSGETWSDEKRWAGRESCRPLSDYVPEWVALGARWIGGCCRVSPTDITNIRTALNATKTGENK